MFCQWRSATASIHSSNLDSRATTLAGIERFDAECPALPPPTDPLVVNVVLLMPQRVNGVHDGRFERRNDAEDDSDDACGFHTLLLLYATRMRGLRYA